MQRVLGIYLPSDDDHFPRMIRKGKLIGGKGTYQLNKLEAALPYVKHKGLAIDIGAHVGLWTRVLAAHFEQVVAFEPVHDHALCLEMNCLGLKNVRLVTSCALGSGVGVVTVVPTKGNSGNAYVSLDALAVHPPIVTQPLDDCIEKDQHSSVSFIKVDVEGYEYEVVLGATSVIVASKPVMVVEQKPGHAERYGRKTGEVLDLLKSMGARIVWEKSGDFCLTWG